MINQSIETCKQLVTDPAVRKECLLSQKENKRGIVGYFSNYIPEEIIAAAGFHPLRVIGSLGDSNPNRKTLFNPVCSFVQDVYASAAAGDLDFLSNVIFPNSCDSLKVLQQIWSYEKLSPSTYGLQHPINNDEASVQYFAEQLKSMAGYLAAHGGVSFTESDLRDIIVKYNQTRDLLGRLYKIRKANPDFLSGSEAVALMTAGLIMDRDKYNQILKEIVASPSHVAGTSKQNKRIVIMGPLTDNLQLLEEIERFGVTIVYEDITNAARYGSLNVRTEGDPYVNLACRYLHAAPSPTLNSDRQQWQTAFKKQMADLKPDGVIYINQKFCEPHVHQYLGCVGILRTMDINTLMLEVEHDQQTMNARDLVRIESFLEIVGVQ